MGMPLRPRNPHQRPPQAEYEQYLRSEHWQGVRRRALDYADDRCQLCYSTQRLEVHHRTYERVGQERPADVVVLCAECHGKHHDRHKGDGIMLYAPPSKSEARVSQRAVRPWA